jgi:hypothetical protein
MILQVYTKHLHKKIPIIPQMEEWTCSMAEIGHFVNPCFPDALRQVKPGYEGGGCSGLVPYLPENKNRHILSFFLLDKNDKLST